MNALTDTELELLTAAVDGPLSDADAVRFDALLRANPQAAAFARQLRADARRLRRLSQHRAPVGLAAAVLARLPVAAPSQPTRPARPRRSAPAWLPYAVAASLLFTVSAGSFWFFADKSESDANARARLALPVVAVAPPAVSPRVQPEPDPEQPAPPVVAEVLPRPRSFVPPPAPREVALMPRTFGGDVVGAGISEPTKPLQAIELRLPVTGAIAEFAEDGVKARFAATFATDPALRIDLFSRNLPAGIDALTAAAKAAGVTLTTDAATQDCIAKKLPLGYALLLEGLTPTELADVMDALAKHAGGPQPAVMSAHAFAAGTTEQREWKDVFGRDLNLFRAARSDQPSPIKPISDGTLGKLKNAVGKNPDKAGLVLTYLPLMARSAPAKSREISAFLAGRGDRKPGTATALFVVRPAGN